MCEPDQTERALLVDYTNWLLERPGWPVEPEATLDAFLTTRRLEQDYQR